MTVLTPEEIAVAARDLSETRESLRKAVGGLSPAQWNFKPAADSWSIGEIAEHIVVVERVIQGVVCHIGDAPATAPDRVQADVDRSIREEVPQRANRFQAPPHLHPSEHWGREEALQNLDQCRKRTVELLAAPALRGFVRPHPVMGPWDGYQWLLAAAAHCARHTRQIEEVKGHPDYPGDSEEPTKKGAEN